VVIYHRWYYAGRGTAFMLTLPYDGKLSRLAGSTSRSERIPRIEIFVNVSLFLVAHAQTAGTFTMGGVEPEPRVRYAARSDPRWAHALHTPGFPGRET
jgi:hypothetical protein